MFQIEHFALKIKIEHVRGWLTDGIWYEFDLTLTRPSESIEFRLKSQVRGHKIMT